MGAWYLMDAKSQCPPHHLPQFVGMIFSQEARIIIQGLVTDYCASESYIWKATKMTLHLLYRDSYKNVLSPTKGEGIRKKLRLTAFYSLGYGEREGRKISQSFEILIS